MNWVDVLVVRAVVRRILYELTIQNFHTRHLSCQEEIPKRNGTGIASTLDLIAAQDFVPSRGMNPKCRRYYHTRMTVVLKCDKIAVLYCL